MQMQSKKKMLVKQKNGIGVFLYTLNNKVRKVARKNKKIPTANNSHRFSTMKANNATQLRDYMTTGPARLAGIPASRYRDLG